MKYQDNKTASFYVADGRPSVKNFSINRTGLLLVMFALLTGFAVWWATSAMASVGSGGGLPYEEGLANLRASVTGPVAFTLSIVGIVVGGGMLIFGGDLGGFFKFILFLILIISVLVGAQNMMSSFFGKGAEIAMLNTYISALKVS